MRRTVRAALVALLITSCAPETSGPGSTKPAGAAAGSGGCGHHTDAGFLICCGRETEIPEISCVDLSIDGGQYGVFKRCLRDGERFDAKFAGAQCCKGLVVSDLSSPSTSGMAVDDAGCSTSSPPSTKTCLPCGNARCDSGENRCNCPADCTN